MAGRRRKEEEGGERTGDGSSFWTWNCGHDELTTGNGSSEGTVLMRSKGIVFLNYLSKKPTSIKKIRFLKGI